MKSLSLVVLAVTMALAQSLTFSTLASVSLALLNLNQPASAFFGMFRRRPSALESVLEETIAPEGPVEFSDPDFQRRTGGLFGGSLGGRDRFFAGGFPNLGNIAGLNFQPDAYRRLWPVWFPTSPSMMSRPAQPQFQQQMPVASHPAEPESSARVERSDNEPQINTEEAESFFTLLAETDENKCISRLVCELGADPARAGELGGTISEIIGSLTDFPAGSRVSEYNQILKSGRTSGVSSCVSQFSSCDEESYSLMRESQMDQAAETTEDS